MSASRQRPSRAWRLLGPSEIELVEVEVPAPTGRELVVRVLAATTCGTDLKVFRRGGHPRMLAPPCPFGHEVAGEIAAVGPSQHRFAVGERVVVSNSAPCGRCLSCRRGRGNLCSSLSYLNGAFADHLLVPERFTEIAVHRFDDRLTPPEAALAEPLACALHCVEVIDATLERWLAAGSERPRAVVLGAGPLGLLLIGLLAQRGVAVSAADPHQGRLHLAGQLGAREVLEVTDREAPLPPSERFDLTVDATGSPAAWRACLERVEPGGSAVFFGGTAAGVELAVDAQDLHYRELSLLGVYHHRPENVARALELLSENVLPHRLLISGELPLERLPEALRRMADREALKLAMLT